VVAVVDLGRGAFEVEQGADLGTGVAQRAGEP
jgi:hypothetical protein